ncbi:DUF805 domain-containing protein [Thioclava sp. GXIMD4216]|uniref:DUF805 domain-containing protein n=1 Tax=Thioclava sp. GXIMD4216 TaxID=3131929 RepID=UPI0030CF7600
MRFQTIIRTCLTRDYANFSGRATRSEFWLFILFFLLANIVLSLLDGLIFGGLSMGAGNGRAWFISNGGPLEFLFSLCVVIPLLAVSVRRLHDIDRSGWWLLLHALPPVGQIILFVFMLGRTRPGPNRFGPDPQQ